MSIRPKLLLTFLALAVLPLLALGIASYSISKTTLEAQTISSLETIADLKAKKVTDYLSSKQLAIRTLKNSIIVNKMLPVLNKYSDDFEHPDFLHATSELDKRLRNLQEVFALDDIVLASPDGKMLYLSNAHHVSLWRGQQIPLENSDDLLSHETVHYFKNHHEDGRYGVLFTAPVRSIDDQVIGLIVLEVDISSLQNMISDSTGLGSSGFTVISKKHSEQSYLYLTPNKKGAQKPPVDPIAYTPRGNPMQRALEGQNGSGIETSCSGQQIIAAWRHIPLLEMGLVSRLGATEAFGTIDHLRFLTTVISSIVFIIAGGIALLVFQTIAIPLMSLKKGAEQIGAGNLDYRVPIERKDEFGLLSATFNDMANSLKIVTASRDELNQEIFERKKAVKAVKEERSFLQAIIDGVVDPIMVISSNYEVLMMNRSAQEHLPHNNDKNRKWLCHEASHRSDTPCIGIDHPCPLVMVQQTNKAATVIHQHSLPDGQVRSYELQASPLWNEDGSLLGIIEAARDITARIEVQRELAENQEKLMFLAHHDELTKLPNRWLFSDRLQQLITKAQRTKNQIAVLLLDVDRFKTINDTLGHPVGDKVLQEVARRLQSSLRESDVLARLGGDEFLIALDEITDANQVNIVVAKIIQSLSKPMNIDGYELTATASMGIALYPDDTIDEEGLFKCADVAMYRAKEMGRNGHQYFTADMNERAYDRFSLESELRKALELDQFFLEYQPQCDMRTGRVTGAEALIRWQHPERGLIPPFDFIPLAEETGLIVPIGEWVLRTASRQCKQWQDAGLPPLRVAVNISARQFRQKDFTESVDKILSETGLEPRYLDFEITETVIMENVNEAIMTLTDFKARGFRLSIDDFGTGYSSLSYLKKFPIDKLKIDRSFVRDITNDANDAAIATSIIALAKSMEMDVIAEGVETVEQRYFLIEKMCTLGQGYLFSKPLNTEKMTALLEDRPFRAGNDLYLNL